MADVEAVARECEWPKEIWLIGDQGVPWRVWFEDEGHGPQFESRRYVVARDAAVKSLNTLLGEVSELQDARFLTATTEEPQYEAAAFHNLVAAVDKIRNERKGSE